MQVIYLITTGGTIEKEYSERLCMVLNQTARIGRYMKRLRLPDCKVEIVPLLNKDSLEMTHEDRASLVAEVAKLLPSQCPIVITHGTDTLVESGMAIEREIPHPPVPVILTGAMKPLGFDSSDGLQNLTESLFASRVLGPGVHVVFHCQVFPVGQVRKDRAKGTFVRMSNEQEPPQTASEVDGAV
jgi:L-asparaginase